MQAVVFCRVTDGLGFYFPLRFGFFSAFILLVEPSTGVLDLWGTSSSGAAPVFTAHTAGPHSQQFPAAPLCGQVLCVFVLCPV